MLTFNGHVCVGMTHQHSTHRSTQCTHLHSSLQRQSVFVFASRFLDPQCNTDRVLIWLKKKNRFTPIVSLITFLLFTVTSPLVEFLISYVLSRMSPTLYLLSHVFSSLFLFSRKFFVFIYHFMSAFVHVPSSPFSLTSLARIVLFEYLLYRIPWFLQLVSNKTISSLVSPRCYVFSFRFLISSTRSSRPSLISFLVPLLSSL